MNARSNLFSPMFDSKVILRDQEIRSQTFQSHDGISLQGERCTVREPENNNNGTRHCGWSRCELAGKLRGRQFPPFSKTVRRPAALFLSGQWNHS